MKITIEYNDPADLLDQIALYLERAAKSEIRVASTIGGKRRMRGAEFAASAINCLACSIREMKAVKVQP